MPKLFILFSTPPAGSPTIAQFEERAKGRVEIHEGDITNVRLVLGGPKTELSFAGESVAEGDAIFVRRVPGGAGWLAALKTRFPKLNWLQTHDFGNIQGKLNQYAAFDRAGLPIPLTALVGGDDPAERARQLGEILGWPMVVKEARSSHGLGLNLVNTVEELAELLATEGHVWRLVCQEFTPNDRDYRVVVVGDEVKLIVERIRHAESGEWRNNVSLGAERLVHKPEDMPAEISELAVKAAKAIGFKIAGVDIMPAGEGKYVVLEVNSSPDLNPGTDDAVINFILEELNVAPLPDQAGETE